MRLSRFERRIFAAIIAVAFVTVGGAVWLAFRAVQEAYELGVRPELRAQLDRSTEVHAQAITRQVESSHRAADAIAYDHRVVAAVQRGQRERLTIFLRGRLARYRNVARIELFDRSGERIVMVEEPSRLDPDRYRSRDLGHETSYGHVVVTVVTDWATQNELLRSGEMAEDYGRLLASSQYIYRVYGGTYLALLLSFVAIALAVGIVVSRRVTRRVAILAEATERVGRGDLSVTVPTDGTDEIAELTRAFNAMVRDIGESRDRIEYLQRIGAWQEFARRLAHEIKNPLTPIQLAMQEVHRTYKGDDPRYKKTVDDAAAIVEEEIATLRRLVSEFSEFARLPVAALENADLGGFVREALRGVDPAAMMLGEGEPPVLSIEVAEEAMPVKIDAQMLRRVVDNLLRNAVHAVVASAPPAGGKVIVAARLEDDDAVLEVRDNGPGIEPELRARVFDPYYTTKGEGTGLGLAIVKKVVLEHGGAIDCAQAPEGGAAFRVRLPRVAPT